MIFITDQGENTGCTLNKFMDYIKLRGKTDSSNRVLMMENFENWASRNFRIFR